MVPMRGCAGQRWGAERSRGVAEVSRPGRQAHTSHQRPWPKVLVLRQADAEGTHMARDCGLRLILQDTGTLLSLRCHLLITAYVNPNPAEAGCAWGWRVAWGESSQFEIVWSGGVRVKGTSGYRELAVWQSARRELRARHQGQNRPPSSRTTERPEQSKPWEQSIQCTG